MSRNRYGTPGAQDPSYTNGNGYGNMRPPDQYNTYDDSFEDRYTAPRTNSPSTTRNGYQRQRPVQESSAEKQIGAVLDHIRTDWTELCDNTCVPVHVALQLLDTSSIGRAHQYREFQQSHQYLENSLKGIVHEHHQGFNSSIGTFHKIQTSIQASQKRVRYLKDVLGSSKASLGNADTELRKLASASQNYDALLKTLTEVEELRLVPDQLEARISEKRFLTAVDVLQTALRRIRVPALDDIGALSELRTYLANQETALTDILLEELHDHLYLKSPYCQERWQSLAKNQSGTSMNKPDGIPPIRPFYEVLDSLDLSHTVVEDPGKNPEADTFNYIGLLVEALNKLGRLEDTVNTIKQRLPVELFAVVNETNGEVDQKHPSSLRGGMKAGQGNLAFGKETGIKTDVIYDLLWTLYSKFEAIAEGHRVFHDVVKAILRREGTSNTSTLLGGFRELWNLYQNEIKSLLHNYVTTDADVYQFSSGSASGIASQDGKREHLFQFSNTDPKSLSITTEYQELEGIIRSAVPGLISSSRKAGDDKKRVGGRTDSMLDRSGTRRTAGTLASDGKGGIGAHKSLVEPSVFNMSLLLPPTLAFLQRLKSIVPPSSDLAKSTLTSFLDNFLVNVFLPQLEETLTKLSDTVFSEADSFQQDPQSGKLSRRPVFKGTTAFFALITAFCRMLDKIPHDQALSQLIISQMITYYDRCYDWFKSLVAQSGASDSSVLKFSATLAEGPGDIHDTLQKLWISDGDEQPLLEKEVGLLILQTNEKPLEAKDIVKDRETIQSLCVLYTSMKWLAIKIEQLRFITRTDVDSSRATAQKPGHKRWTLLNDKEEDDTPVYLPMTQETVGGFDSIVSSYQELAIKVLLTLHMEIRCQIIYALSHTLSPTPTPYLLEQEVKDPDPQILSVNADLIAYEETLAMLLRDRETAFIRTGLGLLVNSYLVTNAGMVKAMNKNGYGRMNLNIRVLQQNLKNIEENVSLGRALRYFELFSEGAEAVVKEAQDSKDRGEEEGGVAKFNYEELKTLIELCYSEQVSSPERGTSTVAKRREGEDLLKLSEYMWES